MQCEETPQENAARLIREVNDHARHVRVSEQLEAAKLKREFNRPIFRTQVASGSPGDLEPPNPPEDLSPDYAPTPEDNWPSERGSGTHVCGTCMWFVSKLPLTEEGKQLGRCRRHAPTLGGWPAMFESDFCGDHKLR